MGRLLGSRRCLFPNLKPVARLILNFYNKNYSLNGVNYDSVMAMPGATFSNATGGYVRSATGLIRVPPNTPRIGVDGYVSELASTNLLQNSIGLTGTNWIGQNTTVTANNAMAPDGTQTATLNTATATSSTGAGANTNSSVSVTAGLIYTVSAYFKAGTAGFGVLIVNSVGGAYVSVIIDLSNGAITSTGLVAGTMFTNQTSKSESAGNGWYRLSITWTAGVSTTVPFVWGQCNTGTPNFQAGGNVPCTLGQTNYVWGGQFEQSAVATSYIPTYNAITNLIQQSNYLANAPWTSISSSSAANNTAIAPDATQTASTVTTTAAAHGYRQAVTVTAGSTYTFSFYAKLGTMTQASYSVFNITQATELITATSYTSKVNAAGWSRIQVTFTVPTGCTSVGCYPVRDSGATGTIFIWGCQLELGNMATTFVPCSPAVTNVNLQSNFASGWNLQGSTLTTGATDPLGGTSALTLSASATAGNVPFNANAAPTTVANSPYTYSAFIKAGTSQIGVLEIASSAGNFVAAYFDVKNGAVTQKVSGGVFTILNTAITPSTNGFYRCSITFQTSSAVTMPTAIGNAASGTVGTSAGYGLPTSITAGITTIFYGTQIETGYGANQYVATTTASASAIAQTSATKAAQTSASRAPDALSFGSALGLSESNVRAMSAQGSFLSYQSNLNTLASLFDPTTNSFVNLGSISNGGGNFSGQIFASGSLVKNLYQSSPVTPATATRKAAASFGGNKLLVAQNGVQVPDPALGDGTFSGALGISQLFVGYSQNQQSSPQANGYIQKVQLFGTALTQSQLNELTK